MSLKIISRMDALKKRLPRYYTGKECVFGHISERSALSGNCLECKKSTHKNKILETRKEWLKEKGYYWERVNPALLKNAKNAKTKWESSDIKKILKRSADGSYAHTTLELAKMLKRSYRSVERARNRYSGSSYDV